MRLDDEGVARQRGDRHHRQSSQGKYPDVAVDFCQYVLQAVFFTDLARIGAARRLHQVVDQVVVPARTGARHPHRKNDHARSSRAFSEFVLVIPTRMPKFTQIFGVAKESLRNVVEQNRQPRTQTGNTKEAQ